MSLEQVSAVRAFNSGGCERWGDVEGRTGRWRNYLYSMDTLEVRMARRGLQLPVARMSHIEPQSESARDVHRVWMYSWIQRCDVRAEETEV